MFDADANVVQVADGLVPARYLGLHRFKRDGEEGAREVVVAEMKTLGLLVLHPGKADAEGNVPMLEAEARTIQTPFGDRGGVVIEPWLTDQWYVNAAELAKAPIEAVKTGAIEIVPKSWEKTYFNWMDNIQPWCVSRQLWWGHQIPAWYGPSRNDELLGTFRSQRGLGSVACERGETLSRGMKVRRSKQQHCSTIVVRAKLQSRTIRSLPFHWEEKFQSAATPTSSTHGSPPPCGPSPRWAGRTRRPRWSPAIIPTTC
jgi:valyl-tRNA synthetase